MAWAGNLRLPQLLLRSQGFTRAPAWTRKPGVGWADAAQRPLELQEGQEGAGGSLRDSCPSGLALSAAKAIACPLVRFCFYPCAVDTTFWGVQEARAAEQTLTRLAPVRLLLVM